MAQILPEESKMARFKLLVSLVVLIGLCTLAATELREAGAKAEVCF